MMTGQVMISTEELAQALEQGKVVLLDATFTLPGASPDAVVLYGERHLPGAIFFDINGVADPHTSLPHMLPEPALFEAAVGAMGISNDTDVVVYDTPGLMSAARVWWSFKVMGHDRVRILDGGLKAWQAEGRPLTTDVPQPKAVSFSANFRPELVHDRAQVLAHLEHGSAQIIDARSADRFHGRVPEPRPGLRSGRMPGSLNLPFDQLSDPATGRVRSLDELQAAFASAGLESGRPVVTTCGSGVTAAVLLLGLHLLGREDVALYDGSWAEWGMEGDTPVV